MLPVIRIDDDVYEALKQRAVELNLVFGSPNEILRHDYVQERAHIEIALSRKSALDYPHIPVHKRNRNFFPGYNVMFNLETDLGVIETCVTSASKKKNTRLGDPDAGAYIRSGLTSWYDAHPELKLGSILHIEALDPKKRYKLSIASI